MGSSFKKHLIALSHFSSHKKQRCATQAVVNWRTTNLQTKKKEAIVLLIDRLLDHICDDIHRFRRPSRCWSGWPVDIACCIWALCCWSRSTQPVPNNAEQLKMNTKFNFHPKWVGGVWLASCWIALQNQWWRDTRIMFHASWGQCVFLCVYYMVLGTYLVVSLLCCWCF